MKPKLTPRELMELAIEAMRQSVSEPRKDGKALDRDVLETLSESELEGWKWIAAQETVTTRTYAEARRLGDRAALYHLKHFTELGLLRRSGTGPSTRYKVVSA